MCSQRTHSSRAIREDSAGAGAKITGYGPRLNYCGSLRGGISACSTPKHSFLYAELFSFMLNIVVAAPWKVVNCERLGGAQHGIGIQILTGEDSARPEG
jgi:hypothetical protein